MVGRDRVFRAEGVVLRRRNLGEADSILTFFGPERGRFEAIARGVRKSRSRMRGHVEPLTRVRVLVAHGRSLDVLTQAETVYPYRGVREDLDRLPQGLYCAELVDRFTVEHAEHPGLYTLLLDALDALEAGAAFHVVRYFELQLMAFTGFDLQLDSCASCSGPLGTGDILISASAGGFVCAGCRGSAGQGRLVSLRAARVLRYARGATMAEFASVRIDVALARELELATGDAVRHVLDREPATARYLDAVAHSAGAVREPGPEPATMSPE